MGIMKTLTINGTTYEIASVVPKSSVTLLADRWVRDGDAYSQVVEVAGVTTRSKVDLQPTREQLEEFHHKVLAFVTENDNGEVKAYAIGDKPSGDHTMQVTLTEVEGTGTVRGNTVGTTMPRSNFNQTDSAKADYIIGRENIPDKNELQSAIEEAIQQAKENGEFGGSGIHIGSDEPTDGSEVWIDTDEEAPESDGGGASINVTAEVGQTIVVKAVDENGKPTEWEAADFPEASQPDWNAEEWESGHIKNRPFYEEMRPVTLMETTVTAENNEFTCSETLVLTEGETYIVVWDGTEYECVGIAFLYGGQVPAVALGNMYFVGGENNGLPFLFGSITFNGTCAGATTADGTHSISIIADRLVVETIPEKFVKHPITILSGQYSSGRITDVSFDSTHFGAPVIIYAEGFPESRIMYLVENTLSTRTFVGFNPTSGKFEKVTFEGDGTTSGTLEEITLT
jgi:hypothetical protein